jgi:hypothetical protein
LPDLEPDTPGLPRGAIDLGDKYVLLRARDETGVILEGEQADALRRFMVSHSGHGGSPLDWQPKYIHWACLRLLNMQVARCAWKEMAHMSSADRVRRSRNVKVSQCSTLMLF